MIATFGVLAALAGIEHGVGELRQGPVPPPALVIQSWPDAPALEVLGGEPALTVVPNLVLSGLLTLVVAAGLGVASVALAHRRHGGLALLLLSVLLLVVGGGFGPPLIGIILGIAALRSPSPDRRAPGAAVRALAPMWPWLLGLGAAGYLGLLPGTIVLSHYWGVADPRLVVGLVAVAFAGLGLALVAARGQDRLTLASRPGLGRR